MMKYLFLDIDGVLNSKEWFKTHKSDENVVNYFDPQCVSRVLRILEKTNARLVISSSWRIDSELPAWFRVVGFGETSFDTTPYFYSREDLTHDQICHLRGYEISRYIREHEEPESYCILDDDDDFMDSQKENFIQTSYLVGLTDEDMEKAINILNGRK